MTEPENEQAKVGPLDPPKPYQPTEEDLHSSAFWEIQRFYRKMYRGKNYGPSILDCIRVAPSAEDLKEFLEKVWPGASSGTRRRWAKAAELRYSQLAATA